MSKKFMALYERLIVSGIDLGFQRTSPVLNNISICELKEHVFTSANATWYLLPP